jgi:hypothetical protein
MPFRRSPSELRWNSRGCGWRPAAHFACIRVLSMASAHVSLACVQFRTSSASWFKSRSSTWSISSGTRKSSTCSSAKPFRASCGKEVRGSGQGLGPGSSTVETAYSVAMWLYEHASNDFSPQMRRRMIPRFLHASGDRGYVLLVLSALATSPLRLFSIVGEESPS